MKKHQIRIISGQFKRRLIPVLDIEGLRPTPDRVRQTLFNWLDHLWDRTYEDKVCLDLFSGTGALSFEAASRGANHIQMVEMNHKVVSQLREVRNQLGLQDKIRITQMDALVAIERMRHAKYDLIFLDPPFHHAMIEKVIPYLPQVCQSNALIYIEAEMHYTLPEQTFKLLKQDKAGQVFYHLFEYIGNTHE